MKDQYGREIDYLRISITDRCNLRCQYCMPDGIQHLSHRDVLRYEELLRVCQIATTLGITKFKVTGGEPLVRKGCVDFVRDLKVLQDVEQVTLTTNGMLLEEHVDALVQAGIDGINISLDTLDDDIYSRLTGAPPQATAIVRRAAAECVKSGIRTKINAVLLPETLDSVADLAALAENLAMDVRFIEFMPVGTETGDSPITAARVLQLLRLRWDDLHPANEYRGNGPAIYYQSDKLKGRIGFISAMSHKFCDTCNRIRLTSTGELKSCLCFEGVNDLREQLRGGATDEEIELVLKDCIINKPCAHRFGERGAGTEGRSMHEIGG
ncbi:MAG: GTP 3',8-cyclase MoaA [Clostridiales bacterium]|nr:GTP 3',8-cyclase MoaA [Clostridiales bacterium]